MKITVFTPAYNRGYLIGRLYESLKRQTYKDFEWIVVNDASTDNTDELLRAWQKEDNFFKIVYKKEEIGGGKHRAINTAVNIAVGELFYIVDSDDYITDDALERLVYYYKQIKDDPAFSGVSGLKGCSKEKLVGTTFNGEFLDATYLEQRENNISGDKAEAYKTEVLKKFPFAEFDGERFISEDTVWLMIAHEGYKLRWFNEIIYICEYLEDGLSRNLETIYLNCFNGCVYAAGVYKKAKARLLKRIAAYARIYGIAKAKGDKTLNKKAARELGCTVFKLMLSYYIRKAGQKLGI